jgi:acetolactate synthase-1/2/3 large subunit
MGFADFGMEFSNPDFVKFAEAHNAYGHRPERAEDFLPTLKRAYDEGGVHLIDLAIDYSDNHRVLDEEIRRLSAAV